MKKDADAEYGENNSVAADRISKELADKIPLPPFTIETQEVKFLLNQKAVYENIERVPLNHKLMDSVEQFGIMSPILTMPHYYPIAGSQRLRVLWELVKTNPTFNDIKIEVHRFDENWWDLMYLWGQVKERDRMVAIWFQMAELVWKSMYYEDDPKFREYERIGDELPWKHKNTKDYK